MPTESEVINHKQVQGCGERSSMNGADVQYTENYGQQEAIISHEGKVFFYAGQDGAKLQNSNLQRIRELQGANDNLQRQINLIEKELKHSNDALTLLAEKDRCKIIMARNTGEILHILVENDERLKRIAQLEQENNRLRVEVVAQRENFIENQDMNMRAQYASSFFRSKSKLEKNSLELIDLTQE